MNPTTMNPTIDFRSVNGNILSTRPNGFLRVRPDGTLGAVRRNKCYPVVEVAEGGTRVIVDVNPSLAVGKDECRPTKAADLGMKTKAAAKAEAPKAPRTIAQCEATVAMLTGRLSKAIASGDPAAIEAAGKALGTAEENLKAAKGSAQKAKGSSQKAKEGDAARTVELVLTPQQEAKLAAFLSAN